MPQLKRAGCFRGAGSLITISLLQLRRCTLRLLVLSFTLCLCCPFISPAAVLFADNFELGLDWDFYTNDDNKNNGWELLDGVLIQKEPNGDDSPGGERWLIRPDILDLSKVSPPIHILLDIMPLDYFPPNDVWFGFSFLVDPKQPDKGNVVVALLKNENLKKAGLHVAVGGKRWVCSPNNFDMSLWQWCRLHVLIDQINPGKTLHLQARIWPRALPEPQEWMTDCTIEQDVNWQAESVALSTHAQQGKKRNPRAAFDNLLIFQGELSSETELLLSQASLRQETLSSLLREFEQEELQALVGRNGPASPLYSGMDASLFSHMVLLRKLMKWAEARDVANQLISLFPRSPYVDHMGGAEGRTEDQAAEEYAKGITEYYKQNYESAKKLLEQFLQNYPNNWRRDRAQRNILWCLYYGGDLDHFIPQSFGVINEQPNFIYADEILYLLSASLIHQGKGEFAREILDLLEAKYPYSKRIKYVEQMRLESYLFRANLDSLTTSPAELNFVESLLEESLVNTRGSIQQPYTSWYSKNLELACNFYRKIGKDAQDFLLREFEATEGEQRLYVAGEYAQSLIKRGELPQAKEFLREVLSQREALADEHKELRKFLQGLVIRIDMELQGR